MNAGTMNKEQLETLRNETRICLRSIKQSKLTFQDTYEANDGFLGYRNMKKEIEAAVTQLMENSGVQVVVAELDPQAPRPPEVIVGHYLSNVTEDVYQLNIYGYFGGDLETDHEDVERTIEYSIDNHDVFVEEFESDFSPFLGEDD